MLHIYQQPAEHQEAVIVGTNVSLRKLRSAIDRALDTNSSAASVESADGECYNVLVLRQPESSFEDLVLPYQKGPHSLLLPHSLIHPETYRRLALQTTEPEESSGEQEAGVNEDRAFIAGLSDEDVRQLRAVIQEGVRDGLKPLDDVIGEIGSLLQRARHIALEVRKKKEEAKWQAYLDSFPYKVRSGEMTPEQHISVRLFWDTAKEAVPGLRCPCAGKDDSGNYYLSFSYTDIPDKSFTLEIDKQGKFLWFFREGEEHRCGGPALLCQNINFDSLRHFVV